MAFTKAPTQDTHNVKRVPSGGAPFLVSSISTVQPVTLSYTNCFPLTEKQWGGEPVRAVHKRDAWTAATVATGSVTTTGIRGPIVQSYNNYNVFFSKGTSVYAWNQSTNTVAAALSTSTNYGAGSATSFIDSTNARRVAFLESYVGGTTNLYACLEDATGGTTTNLISILADGSRGLVFLNSYLFCVDASGTRIYNSTVGGAYTTWATTDYLDAEQYSDIIQYIAKHKNYIVAFGQSSCEFFYDGGIEVGSPLARQESYATRIGMVKPAISNTGSCNCIAQFEDDLYFIGVSETNSMGLYRVKDFRVEEVGNNQWVQGVFNNNASNIVSISSYQINNNPTVVVEFNSGNPLAYNIIEDVWWTITGSDFVASTSRIGQPYIRLIYLNNLTQDSSTVLSNPVTDTDGVYSVTAVSGGAVTSTIYTEVIDFDVNRYKHLARVDAIGDYKTNDLTLSINPTPNYVETFTSCGSQNASTIGYGNNISWYNLGSPRRFILKFEMSGSSVGIHRGFDIEYNIGAA